MQNPQTDNQHLLERGCIYVAAGSGVVQTVLGSCVSVCLWDAELRCGGMNHFVYPQTTQRELATPQYGNVATVALLKLMREEGCNFETMVAHIIGGGHPEGLTDSVGGRNVEVARKVLKEKGITVLSEDVGGSVGRKIMFDLASGHVAVLKVHKVRNEDWIEE
ncbi:MAG: chemotaxis protein CheD [Chitinispirillales bacterium]|nr:chemotaxis protein CheD [Chitinispirillales bacterium]